MKFKDLLYGEDEEIFTIYTEAQVQRIAKKTIGENLSPREMQFLKSKVTTGIKNFITKIDSSGIGK